MLEKQVGEKMKKNIYDDGSGVGGPGMNVGPMGGGTWGGGQQSPASKGIFGGIPMKKKVWPKHETKKLKQTGLKRRIYKSFEKFGTKGGKIT